MQVTGYRQETQLESYLTFRMDNETFAVSVTKVTELLEMLPVTNVPRASAFMRGVINLRGAVVPVIDTRIKFSLKAVEDTINTCIVVMTIQMDDEIVKIGAIVDAVSEVIEITKDAVLPLPAVGNKATLQFLQGVIKDDDRFIMVLDVDRVFSNEDLLSFQTVDIQA
jgi:purine-binding chemotaxis protein CheW